jgi:hypothetical protein
VNSANFRLRTVLDLYDTVITRRDAHKVKVFSTIKDGNNAHGLSVHAIKYAVGGEAINS